MYNVSQSVAPSTVADEKDMGTFVAVCPNLDEVVCDVGYFSTNYDQLSVPLSMISCSLSCLASIAIVITFLLWKDIRSGLRWVITYLAIADFFTAASYLVGSFNKIAFNAAYNQHGAAAAAAACTRFDYVCQIQSFMSSWSSMSSFMWTTVLAFYLYWTIVKKEVKSINRLFPLYHLLAWGLPMVIVLPLLVTSNLGYSNIATSGWCYIRTDQGGGENTNQLAPKTIGLIFVGGKAMEIATYVIVISLYCGVFCKISREKKLFATSHVQHRVGISALLQKVELKIYAIPAFFIVLRIWGTIQFLVSIVVFTNGEFNRNGCVSSSLNIVYTVLAVTQAIGDGGQGWANGILYIILSSKIRKRLFCNPLCCCFKQINPSVNRPVHTVTWSRQHSSSLTMMTTKSSSHDDEVTGEGSTHLYTTEQHEEAPLLGQPT